MSPEPASRRPNRLQFSLRALLFAMALVGVALTIYRWPWIESRALVDVFDTPVEETTTYRRGWTGKRLKHGLKRIAEQGASGFYEEEFFVDDILVWNATYNARGEISRRHHLGNNLHGPFIDWRGKIVGQHRYSKMVGAWLHKQSADRLIEQQFEESRPQGLWQWKTKGQVTQTATFERGRLVQWNGRSAGEELARWCEANDVDAITREVLGTRLEHVDLDRESVASDDTLEWPLLTSYHRLILHDDDSYGRTDYPSSPYIFSLSNSEAQHMPERPVGEVFVEQALLRCRVVEYHFGVICFVPYAAAHQPGVDRTGVLAIEFAPGSAAEEAWLAPVVEEWDVHLSSTDPEWRFQLLFAGVPIQIDAEWFRPEVERSTSPSFRPPPVHRRPRRDVLGLILYANGWSVQQRGNVLEILPWQMKR